MSTAMSNPTRKPISAEPNSSASPAPPQPKETGTVKFFDDLKGFGFISRANGEDVFVHHTGIVGKGYKILDDGARVEFTVAEGPKGYRLVKKTRPNFVIPMPDDTA
jgi:CspA family cold shock protein